MTLGNVDTQTQCYLFHKSNTLIGVPLTAADTSVQLGGLQATHLHPAANSRSGPLKDIHDTGEHTMSLFVHISIHY